MFTGLIEAIGTVKVLSPTGHGARLVVAPDRPLDLQPGDSIAISGPCLTVERASASEFSVFASGETLARTTLGSLKPGYRVNLERALAFGGRLGGHLVTGHVDGTGVVVAITRVGESWEVSVRPECDIMPLVAEKGSVAIDGVSLTVASVGSRQFGVVLIPETLARTTLGGLKVGTRVNLEADVLARYVVRWLESHSKGAAKSKLDLERLRELGFQ